MASDRPVATAIHLAFELHLSQDHPLACGAIKSGTCRQRATKHERAERCRKFHTPQLMDRTASHIMWTAMPDARLWSGQTPNPGGGPGRNAGFGKAEVSCLPAMFSISCVRRMQEPTAMVVITGVHRASFSSCTRWHDATRLASVSVIALMLGRKRFSVGRLRIRTDPFPARRGP